MMKDDALLLLESSEDGGANAHVVVGAKMAASAADRRESLAMVDPCYDVLLASCW